MELGIIFWLLAQCKRDQSSSSRRHLEAAGDERGAGPLFLDKDETNVPVMVTAPGMGSDELWMSFGFALQKSIAFPHCSQNWIHSEEQQYMENGIFCLLKSLGESQFRGWQPELGEAEGAGEFIVPLFQEKLPHVPALLFIMLK